MSTQTSPSVDTNANTNTNINTKTTDQSTLTSRPTARRVVTTEGVVLGANLDRYSGEEAGLYEQGGEGRRTRGQDHVMSFMSLENLDDGSTGGVGDEDGVARLGVMCLLRTSLANMHRGRRVSLPPSARMGLD